MPRAQDLIDRLATLLQAHVDLVSSLENTVMASTATGDHDRLSEELESLRSLRRRILDDMRSLQNAGLEGEELEDAWALAGFYLEAGSRREERALEKASKLVDTSGDLREVEELRDEARRLMSMKDKV
ncbi:MAG: hypothetical protein F7B18_08135 [Desulfurococcales archaeon]|nr:hypothetical protein [Desulfurococcales archaeon]